ncbi:hypothetical protein Pmani_013010 [Petrolisthes manimaculis]|uniref:limulus clotting factor C n=1 Tax=Petrolisthes manimaculis TaxID=1843537 RepID=A0AAE1PZC0_9EUCA|nr:hypothetical protein Pmani_013010 [Petrolisthes manimaculis]
MIRSPSVGSAGEEVVVVVESGNSSGLSGVKRTRRKRGRRRGETACVSTNGGQKKVLLKKMVLSVHVSSEGCWERGVTRKSSSVREIMSSASGKESGEKDWGQGGTKERMMKNGQRRWSLCGEENTRQDHERRNILRTHGTRLSKENKRKCKENDRSYKKNVPQCKENERQCKEEVGKCREKVRRSRMEPLALLLVTLMAAGSLSVLTLGLCPVPIINSVVVEAVINHRSFCGESAYTHRYYMRIIGGRSVVAGEWPWQVALQQKDPYSGKRLGQHCGGTLIHPAWILTAAHCIVDPIFKFALPPPFWTVRVGEVSLSADTTRLYPVAKIITHKYFDAKTWDNDIALVRLRKPLDLEEHAGLVNTICLPSRNMSFLGLHCSVTGWGRTKEHGSNSDLLQTIRVPVMADKKCQRAYRKVGPVSNRMICAGWEHGGMGPCVGDSGGPLQCRARGGPWIQAGITSWGVGCAKPSYPGVYIRVSDYLDWIYKHLENNY